MSCVAFGTTEAMMTCSIGHFCNISFNLSREREVVANRSVAMMHFRVVIANLQVELLRSATSQHSSGRKTKAEDFFFKA